MGAPPASINLHTGESFSSSILSNPESKISKSTHFPTNHPELTSGRKEKREKRKEKREKRKGKGERGKGKGKREKGKGKDLMTKSFSPFAEYSNHE